MLARFTRGRSYAKMRIRRQSDPAAAACTGECALRENRHSPSASWTDQGFARISHARSLQDREREKRVPIGKGRLCGGMPMLGPDLLTDIAVATKMLRF